MDIDWILNNSFEAENRQFHPRIFHLLIKYLTVTNYFVIKVEHLFSIFLNTHTALVLHPKNVEKG